MVFYLTFNRSLSHLTTRQNPGTAGGLRMLHFLTVFVKNKCSFIYFSNIFLNLVLKINVRLRFI